MSILKMINRLLQPLGAKLVRRVVNDDTSNLTMDSMIKRLAQRGMSIQTVVDIGASDGKWSIACMKHFPSALYLAVEPLEERRKVLEDNKSKFPNFDYALCIAGEVDGEEISLNVTPDLDGSTIEGQGLGVSRICCTRTVNSLVVERGLSGPYLLKFDTHGYEVPILAGCNNLLANTSAIIMETYNFQLTPTSLKFYDMCAKLERLGFRPADIAEPLLRLHDKTFWQVDILFLKVDSGVFQYPHYR